MGTRKFPYTKINLVKKKTNSFIFFWSDWKTGLITKANGREVMAEMWGSTRKGRADKSVAIQRLVSLADTEDLVPVWHKADG